MATPTVGAVGEGASTTNAITPTVLTTTVDGAWVVGCGTDWQALGNGTSTDVAEADTPTDFSAMTVRKAAATALAGTVVTLNFDAAGAGTPMWTWAAAEITPSAGGTLAVDASSPPLASTANAPVTTASFEPPEALLVLCLLADDFNGSGATDPTLTPTSSGLTFTEQVRRWGGEGGGATNGVAVIFTAPVAAGAGARTVSVTTSNTNDSLALKVFVVTEAAAGASVVGRPRRLRWPGRGPTEARFWRRQLSTEPAPSGTTFPVSLDGAVTPTGSAGAQPQKALAGSVAPAGALTRQPQPILTGTVAPTGAVIKALGRVFGGTITPTGALATARLRLVALAGAITPSSALVRATSKALTASAAPSAVLVRQVGRLLSGTVTPTGAVATIRTRLLAVAGSLTPAGAVVRQVGKAVAGVLAPSGALTRQPGRRMGGAVTPTGALATTRIRLVALAGAISPTGLVRRTAGKALAGATSPTGSVVKQIAVRLVGASGPVGALAKLVGRLFGGSSAPAGAIETQTLTNVGTTGYAAPGPGAAVHVGPGAGPSTPHADAGTSIGLTATAGGAGTTHAVPGDGTATHATRG